MAPCDSDKTIAALFLELWWLDAVLLAVESGFK